MPGRKHEQGQVERLEIEIVFLLIKVRSYIVEKRNFRLFSSFHSSTTKSNEEPLEPKQEEMQVDEAEKPPP